MPQSVPANTPTTKKFPRPEFEDTCPACADGTLLYVSEEECTCHISPPCEPCVTAPLVCSTCGFNIDTDWVDYVENGNFWSAYNAEQKKQDD